MQKTSTLENIISDLKAEEKKLKNLFENEKTEDPSVSIINNILNFSKNLEVVNTSYGKMDYLRS